MAKKKSSLGFLIFIGIIAFFGLTGGGAVVVKAIHGAHHAVSTLTAGLSGNVALGNKMAAAYGWSSGSQWNCLDTLWQHESNWSDTALNRSSGATGIPQLLPSAHAIPANWSSPAVQIAWGLDYIKGRWGSPCGAWDVYCNHPGGPAGCWY